MFEPGGKSVRCQNLHEPLLSPCMFEPMHVCLIKIAVFTPLRMQEESWMMIYMQLAEQHFDLHG